ncbi:MAG: hypothetical protein JNM39_17895 [Bdellovibrionaceae bacterium]|nr:hypothetical protein [Pseudobdellovibrionaceae bacterium]
MKILFLGPLLLIGLIGFSAAAQVEDGRYIAVQSGYGILSSNLSGAGFNSSLPGKGGILYGVDLSYQNQDSGTQYNLKYDKVAVDMTAPSGVTPTSISVFREELRFGASIAPWDSGVFEHLRLGLGYAMLTTGGTDTSPNNVLTKQSSQGIFVSALYKMKIETDWVILPELLIYLPHQVKESQQITGYNPKFIGYELKLSTEYSLSDDIVGYVGISYRTDQVSYDGLVNRGVTGGQDTRTLIAIPVGIKIGY